MGKVKNQAWLYFRSIGAISNRKNTQYQCQYCSKQYSGNATRMSLHLAVCKEAPSTVHSVFSDERNEDDQSEKDAAADGPAGSTMSSAVSAKASLSVGISKRRPTRGCKPKSKMVDRFTDRTSDEEQVRFNNGKSGASTSRMKYYDDIHKAHGCETDTSEVVIENNEDYDKNARARMCMNDDPVELAILDHLHTARLKADSKDNVQLFLDSLAEPLRRLTAKQFAMARIKIDSILYDITYECSEAV